MYRGYRNHQRARKRDNEVNNCGVIVERLESIKDGETVVGEMAKILCYELVPGRDPYRNPKENRLYPKVKILSVIRQPGDELPYVFIQETKPTGNTLTVFPTYRPTGDQQPIAPEVAVELLRELHVGHPVNQMHENVEELALETIAKFFPETQNECH